MQLLWQNYLQQQPQSVERKWVHLEMEIDTKDIKDSIPVLFFYFFHTAFRYLF